MNEISLSEELITIEDEILFFSHRTQRSLWELGKRFKHVKENDLTHGNFMNWYKGLGFEKNFVSDAINVAEEFPNFPTLGNFKSQTALRIASHLPKEVRDSEHVTFKGETKTVDEMTIRELQELKKLNKRKDEEIERLRNAEPEVIEKEVVKEVKVTPHDYDGLKSDNKQLSLALKQAQAELDATNKRNEFIEDQHKQSLEDRKDDLQRKEKLEKMEKELSRLANRREKLSDQIDTIKELTSLKFEVDKILEKIAPYYFNHNINAIRQDPTLEQSFVETVDALQKWCDEMYNLLGLQNTIEGEIIND